jgi:hypothetical protein
MHENRETSETPAAKPGSRAVGEGNSRTARMYVPEESHDGIVPILDCWDCGGADCDAGAKGIASLGTVRLSWADDGYLNPECSILIPRSASPPVIRDKNRMR